MTEARHIYIDGRRVYATVQIRIEDFRDFQSAKAILPSTIAVPESIDKDGLPWLVIDCFDRGLLIQTLTATRAPREPDRNASDWFESHAPQGSEIIDMETTS